MPGTPTSKPSKFDPDKDRYPKLAAAISAAREHPDFPTEQVERFELVCHASGDVTWRAWTPRAEEPIGGYAAEGTF